MQSTSYPNFPVADFWSHLFLQYKFERQPGRHWYSIQEGSRKNLKKTKPTELCALLSLLLSIINALSFQLKGEYEDLIYLIDVSNQAVGNFQSSLFPSDVYLKKTALLCILLFSPG